MAVLHAAEPVRRTISESIALAKAHAKELGFEPTIVSLAVVQSSDVEV